MAQTAVDYDPFNVLYGNPPASSGMDADLQSKGLYGSPDFWSGLWKEAKDTIGPMLGPVAGYPSVAQQEGQRIDYYNTYLQQHQ